MATLLHINSSVRNEGSISRQLTAEFLQKWKAATPGAKIVERDLAASPLPHLTEETLGAFFTPAEKRSPGLVRAAQLSDQLVAELTAADVILIGAPMYNFSIGSGLKAWIDLVARVGLTFNYTESGPVGLLQGKKVYVFTSRGGVYTQGPAKSMDFHEPYLRAILGFIGLTDITFVHTEGLAMGEDAAAKAVSQTRTAIDALVA
jgi:FMN-dependent NADH-azoreductase